jgi:hypothetical protein
VLDITAEQGCDRFRVFRVGFRAEHVLVAVDHRKLSDAIVQPGIDRGLRRRKFISLFIVTLISHCWDRFVQR